MKASYKAQYNVLLGLMRKAAERYGAADAEVRRAEEARDRAAETLDLHEKALDDFVDRLPEGGE